MNAITRFFKAPIQMTSAAHERWTAIMAAVPDHLEVYAFLLCRPGEALVISDVLLAKQSVTAGRCQVVSADVLTAGECAAADGLIVAGSIHRHPFGGHWLSGVDRILLKHMAIELASEMVVPIQVGRSSRGRIVRCARVYCLVSSWGGYCGSSANVVYDSKAGIPRRQFSAISDIVIQDADAPQLDVKKVKRDVKRLVQIEEHC